MPLTATTNALPPVRMRPGRARRALVFFKQLYAAWKQDHASRLAAALAFYTFLALTPLLILAVLIAGILYGETAARGEIVERTREATGPLGAEIVQGILRGAGRPRDGIVVLGIGLLALLVGASRAFQELQAGLSKILAQGPDMPGGRKGVLRRLVSFGLVLSVSLGLVILMVGGTALHAAGRSLGLSTGLRVARVLDYVITFGLGALFLSLLYRFVPKERAGWKDVGIGAGLSAGLFVLGRFLVSLYIERTSTASSYGVAGLIVILLIWIYFSARVIYFGAEVTRLRAHPGSPASSRSPSSGGRVGQPEIAFHHRTP